MRAAVTVTEPTLDAEIDPRFGRCACFLIVDTDTMNFEAIKNANTSLAGGAGIQSAQLLAEKGADVVLTGNCGPNAHRALSAANIDVIVGCSGVARAAVEQLESGRLHVARKANVPDHFGAADTPNPPQAEPAPSGQPSTARGMGKGRGQCRGMGRGQGGGAGMTQGGGRGGRGRGGRGRRGGGGYGTGQSPVESQS